MTSNKGTCRGNDNDNDSQDHLDIENDSQPQLNDGLKWIKHEMKTLKNWSMLIALGLSFDAGGEKVTRGLRRRSV